MIFNRSIYETCRSHVVTHLQRQAVATSHGRRRRVGAKDMRRHRLRKTGAAQQPFLTPLAAVRASLLPTAARLH